MYGFAILLQSNKNNIYENIRGKIVKNKRNIKNELRRQQRIEAFQRKLDAMEASPEIPQNDRDIKEHEDNSVNIQIANEVTRILSEKKNKESKPLKKVESESSKNEKRTIKKPKKDPDFFEIRYTMPKERSIPGRIINQMMYESEIYVFKRWGIDN